MTIVGTYFRGGMVMRAVLFWTFCLACLLAIAAYVDPALAQGRTLPGPGPSPGPAPLIGMIGLPVAGLVIAAVWLARRLGRSE